MAHYWMKLYTDILDDPKMGTLPDNLWRRTIELMLLSDDNGILPPIDDMTWILDIGKNALYDDLDALMALGHIKIDYVIDGMYHWQFSRYMIERYINRATLTITEYVSGWTYLRHAAFERDNYTCRYCGAPATHVDHVIPRCQNGSDELANLVAACAYCNLSKGGRTPEQAGMKLNASMV